MLKKIFIAGTGAMACLFAGCLSKPGLDIVMFGSWQESIERINREGLKVHHHAGNTTIAKVRAVTDASECSDADLVLVLTKSWQTEKSAQDLFGLLPAETALITLQNGLGNKEILGKYFGLDRIIQGVTTLGAAMLGPGEVRYGGKGVTTLEKHPASIEFNRVLTRAGLDVNIVKDARALTWGKLIINSAVNPLTAILGVNNGELLNRPSAMELVRELVLETSAVASAQGITLPFSDPVLEVEHVIMSTKTNISSMLNDVRRGSRTEIDYINGAVVEFGHQYGTNVTCNRLITQLVRAISEP